MIKRRRYSVRVLAPTPCGPLAMDDLHYVAQVLEYCRPEAMIEFPDAWSFGSCPLRSCRDVAREFWSDDDVELYSTEVEHVRHHWLMSMRCWAPPCPQPPDVKVTYPL